MERHLVRDRRTGHWLTPGLEWRDDPAHAVAFPDVVAARTFLHRFACEPHALEIVAGGQPAAA